MSAAQTAIQLQLAATLRSSPATRTRFGSHRVFQSRRAADAAFDHNLVRRGPWPKRGAPGLLSKSCCPVKPPLSSSHPDRSQLLNPVGVQAGSRTVSQLIMTGGAGKVIEVDGVGGRMAACAEEVVLRPRCACFARSSEADACAAAVEQVSQQRSGAAC